MSRLLPVLLALCASASVFGSCAATASNGPQQVHVSLTHNVDEMHVMFATMGSNSLDTSAQVAYGTSPGTFTQKVTAVPKTYSTDGTQWPGVLYTALLTGLKPSTKVYYAVSANGQTSQQFSFTTAPDEVVYPTVVAMYGDLGSECNTTGCGNPTIDALAREVAADKFNLMVHVGDIAYTSGVQSVWDQFLNQMEGSVANTPYMTIPGNHEHYWNFTGYRNRFAMPGQQPGTINNLWNSFDYGGIHFVGMSTEHDFYEGSWQHRWLEQDLAAAAANRDNVPWIVMYGHRPFQCSSDDYYDCKIFGPMKLQPNIEPLMLKYGVDLYIAGHIHCYERSFQLINATFVSDSYHNPKTPIYVIAGSAGDNEGLTDKWETKPAWSAYRDAKLGYGRVTVTDAKTLTWDFVLSENGTVQDTFTITKS